MVNEDIADLLHSQNLPYINGVIRIEIIPCLNICYSTAISTAQRIHRISAHDSMIDNIRFLDQAKIFDKSIDVTTSNRI